MPRPTNLEVHAARRRELNRQRQAEYAEQHAAMKRLRREPSRRDVASALLDMYLSAATKTSSHAALVEVLEYRGFNPHASYRFIRRLVDRVDDLSI